MLKFHGILLFKTILICLISSCAISTNRIDFLMIDDFCSSNLKDKNTIVREIELSVNLTEFPFTFNGFTLDSSFPMIKARLSNEFGITHSFPSFELRSFNSNALDTFSVMETKIEYKNNEFHTPAIECSYLIHFYSEVYVILQIIDLTSRNNIYCDYLIFNLFQEKKAIHLGDFSGLNVRPILGNSVDDTTLKFYLLDKGRISLLEINTSGIKKVKEIPVSMDFDLKGGNIFLHKISAKAQNDTHFEKIDTCSVGLILFNHENAYR